MTKTVTEWEKILAKEIPNRGLLPKNIQKLKTQEENENPIEKKKQAKTSGTKEDIRRQAMHMKGCST